MAVLDNFLIINLSGISLKILKFSSQKSFPVLFWLWQCGEGMKQRVFISFHPKVRLVKTMVFPVVMYRCESWTINKAEHWRIDAFQLWCWKRLLRVPWTARRCNQSILKEISHSKDCCWSWNSNTLATWCEELTHLKRPWCWARLRAEGKGDDRGWDGWMASPTQWTLVWVDSGSWWWTGRPGVLQFMGSQRVRHDWVTSLSLFTFMHWRRKWQPTPVFLPGESQGLGSLVGCHLWDRRVGHDWSDLAAAAE